MPNSNQQIQAQWEMFHQRLAHQIADEMVRALEAAEAFTVQLKEQNRLLTEQNTLLEERVWSLQECNDLAANQEEV
jgi:galactokinase